MKKIGILLLVLVVIGITIGIGLGIKNVQKQPTNSETELKKEDPTMRGVDQDGANSRVQTPFEKATEMIDGVNGVGGLKRLIEVDWNIWAASGDWWPGEWVFEITATNGIRLSVVEKYRDSYGHRFQEWTYPLKSQGEILAEAKAHILST